MISHDESANLRRFKCADCGKAFKFKHHLKVRTFTEILLCLYLLLYSWKQNKIMFRRTLEVTRVQWEDRIRYILGKFSFIRICTRKCKSKCTYSLFIRFDCSKFLNYPAHFFNPYEVSFNIVDVRNKPKINLSHDRESSHFFFVCVNLVLWTTKTTKQLLWPRILAIKKETWQNKIEITCFN